MMSFCRMLDEASGHLQKEQGQVTELIGHHDKMLTFLTRVRELKSCTQLCRNIPYSYMVNLVVILIWWLSKFCKNCQFK